MCRIDAIEQNSPGRIQLRPLVMIVLAACIALVAFGMAAPAQAAGADQAVIDYDGQALGSSGRLDIEGNVKFTYDDVVIHSDRLSIDWDGEVAEFSGNVQVVMGEQGFSGDTFTYHLPDGTSLMINPSGLLAADGTEEPIRFEGESLRTEGDRMVLEQGRFTTCECTDKGYYLAGQRMEIYPGDRIVLYNVRFVEFGLTLFYWPRFTLPLDRPANAAQLLPKIGYNSYDGWFVRTNFGYGPAGAGGGVLHLDWLQRKGLGIGATHTYRQDDSGEGIVGVYSIVNPLADRTEYQAHWTGTLDSGPWNVDWNAEWEMDGPNDRRRQLALGELSARHRRENGQTTVRVTGDIEARSDEVPTERLTGDFAHTQRLGSTGMELNLRANAFHRKSSLVDRRYHGYSAELKGNAGPIGWSVLAEERVNPVLTQSTSSSTPTWISAGKMPQISLNTRPELSLLGLKVPLEFGAEYGRLTESRIENDEMVHAARSRSSLLAGIRRLRIPAGDRLNFEFSGSLQGFQYEGGLNRLVVASDFRTDLRLTNALTVEGRYEYREPFGDTSPFNSDRVQLLDRVRGTIRYRTSALQVSLSSGYNLRSERPQNIGAEDLVLSLTSTPLPAWSFRLQAAYDIKNEAPRYVAGTTEFGSSESFSLKLGSRYDFRKAEFDRIDASLSWEVANWSLGYAGRYNVREDKFEQGLLTLLRNLDDCREIGFSYDQADGSVWVEYRITAFPSAGLRLGAHEDGLMFDVDGWEELIGS